MKIRILLVVLMIAAGLTSNYAQDSWTQKADFGGGGRSSAAGFSIGNKGYVGTGEDGNFPFWNNDFWEYDPDSDTWSQKADFSGSARYGATGFSIGSKGYIGTGAGEDGLNKDFWEYDPDANSWTQKADFGGNGRRWATGFSIGNKGYIGTGTALTFQSIYYDDWWEYDPKDNTWVQKANFSGSARYGATSFSIGNKGYVGTGYDGGFPYEKDFWEYDPDSNTWTQKAEFGGSARLNAAGFSIGSMGYIGPGSDVSLAKDLWEYDSNTDTWSHKTDFGGSARYYATGFGIGNKGYIGLGYDNNYKSDFWEYSPCSTPTSLSTVNITPTTAKLKWNGTIGVTQYHVLYKAINSAQFTLTHISANELTITGLTPNTTYGWKVQSVCSVPPLITSDGSERAEFTTAPFKLPGGTLMEEAVEETMFGIYPNPVSQTATLSFLLTEGSRVVIELMDVNGRSLKVIGDAGFSEGNHEVAFNRESLGAGVYFLQMKTSQGAMMRKVVLE